MLNINNPHRLQFRMVLQIWEHFCCPLETRLSLEDRKEQQKYQQDIHCKNRKSLIPKCHIGGHDIYDIYLSLVWELKKRKVDGINSSKDKEQLREHLPVGMQPRGMSLLGAQSVLIPEEQKQLQDSWPKAKESKMALSSSATFLSSFIPAAW